MSKNNLSLSNMTTNILSDFVVKNKCNCDCEDTVYIKLIPKEIDDLYTELYKQILYNVTSIKFLNKKKRILSVIKVIDNIITDFCKDDKNYSQYGDDKIFHATIPFYTDYNEISIIKVSDGIDFSKLINISEKTDLLKINSICNDLIEIFSYYLVN